MPASAYQILLDIDTDDDPYTINQFTEESSATVRMILVPDDGGEWISELNFGLGGTCWMCFQEWEYYMYGTSTDIFSTWYPDPWMNHPLFGENWADYALCIDCCGNPGFHCVLYADALGDGFLLEERIFLHSFEAWDIDDSDCQEPPPDLMAFACDYEPCNIIMLSGFVDTEKTTWENIKRLY
jgi:hypothetical protein